MEAFACGHALERRFTERCRPTSPISGREIFRRAAEGDAIAQQLIAETADYLAHGIGVAATLLAPECIVLGGGLSEAGPQLFDPLNGALPRYLLPQLAGLQVIPAQLGYEAGVRGAIALAMEEEERTR